MRKIKITSARNKKHVSNHRMIILEETVLKRDGKPIARIAMGETNLNEDKLCQLETPIIPLEK